MDKTSGPPGTIMHEMKLLLKHYQNNKHTSKCCTSEIFLRNEYIRNCQRCPNHSDLLTLYLYKSQIQSVKIKFKLNNFFKLIILLLRANIFATFIPDKLNFVNHYLEYRSTVWGNFTAEDNVLNSLDNIFFHIYLGNIVKLKYEMVFGIQSYCRTMNNLLISFTIHYIFLQNQ